ncbi:hypothetical protein E4T99_07520 [Neisseria sp. WF04]|nr:hypothetical protein E4T99_07520 [Neisseria sp. WF04]
MFSDGLYRPTPASRYLRPPHPGRLCDNESVIFGTRRQAAGITDHTKSILRRRFGRLTKPFTLSRGAAMPQAQPE